MTQRPRWLFAQEPETTLRNRNRTMTALMVGTIALCLVLLALQIYSLNLVFETRLILAGITPAS